MKPKSEAEALAQLDAQILTIRGQKVILARDPAAIYGVETKALNQAVKRNAEKFPDDFMFVVTHEEFAILRSQFVTLKVAHPLEVQHTTHHRNGVSLASAFPNRVWERGRKKAERKPITARPLQGRHPAHRLRPLRSPLAPHPSNLPGAGRDALSVSGR